MGARSAQYKNNIVIKMYVQSRAQWTQLIA